jgi:hypothetical protein
MRMKRNLPPDFKIIRKESPRQLLLTVFAEIGTLCNITPLAASIYSLR